MKPFWRLYGGWKKLTKLWREQKRSCVKSKTRSMRYTKGGRAFVTTGSRLWAGIGNVGNGNVGNVGNIGNVGAKQGWYLLVSSTLILQITLFTETERLRDFVKTNTELIIARLLYNLQWTSFKILIEVLMLYMTVAGGQTMSSIYFSEFQGTWWYIAGVRTMFCRIYNSKWL